MAVEDDGDMNRFETHEESTTELIPHLNGVKTSASDVVYFCENVILVVQCLKVT